MIEKPTQRAVPAADLAGATCDTCLAAAAVLVALGARRLAFCAHHYRDHALTLTAAGWAIVADSREKLMNR